MHQNGQTWDAVVLDPPKLMHSRDPEEGQLGANKYYDMNVVALNLLRRGGSRETDCDEGAAPERSGRVREPEEATESMA